MSLKGLKNKPSQSAFDLSFGHNFTAKIGELLPISVTEVIPGDTLKFKPMHRTITQPLNSNAFVRLREHVDYFFVPYNLLWRNFNTFITQMENNVQQASSITGKQSISEQHPFITTEQIVNYLHSAKGSNSVWSDFLDDPTPLNYKRVVQSAPELFNSFGYKRAEQTCKLLSYLGYGNFTFYGKVEETSDFTHDFMTFPMLNTSLNPFPLLAYQKIYQDYFRNSQWEDSSPETWNLNYISDESQLTLNISQLFDPSQHTIEATDNLFDLKYVNWHKDYFTGVLPNAQYGDEAALTINIPSLTTYAFNQNGLESGGYIEGDVSALGYTVTSNTTTNSFVGNVDASDTSDYINLNLFTNRASTSLGVIALRQAEFLQKYKEIAQTGGQDYEAQIEKFFGVGVSSLLSDRCQYIGGYSSNININEVVNNNLADAQAQPIIKGKGNSSGNGFINFENKSNLYGVVIGIYHCVPLPVYTSSGQSRYLQKTYAFDYAHPAFDKIGMQQTRLSELVNSPDVYDVLSQIIPQGSSVADYYLGYAPQYAEYKTNYDRCSGAFSSTLDYWQLSMNEEYITDYLTSIANAGQEIDATKQLLTPSFFKINPSFADTIFAVQADSSVDTDQLLVSLYTDIKAVRKLDYNGLPY